MVQLSAGIGTLCTFYDQSVAMCRDSHCIGSRSGNTHGIRSFWSLMRFSFDVLADIAGPELKSRETRERRGQ